MSSIRNTGGPSGPTPFSFDDDALSTAAAAAGPAEPATAPAPAKFPAWVPRRFDFAAAARAAREIIVAQGEAPDSVGPGKADSIVFTDADLTFLKTCLPVYLADKKTGKLMNHPETGKPLALGMGPDRDQRKELAALKQRLPNVPWDDYKFDYRAFDSVDEIMKTPGIGATIDVLRSSDRTPRSRDFVVTARPGDNVAGGLNKYFEKRTVDINGVFVVNSPTHSKALGLVDPELTSAQMKALGMASILKVYQPGASTIKNVKFVDDGEANLAAAAELLPKMFPDIKFEFVDVVHTGGGKHVHRTVARSGAAPGSLVDGTTGRPIDAAGIAAAKSDDAPLPTRRPR